MDFFTLAKISVRNLLKQRFYAFLNILGFALGITVFFLVCIYVYDQYLVDRWNDQQDRIYRLEQGDWAITGTFQGPYLKEQVAGIDQVLRVDLNWFKNADILIEEQLFSIPEVIMADSTFFDFFPLRFIEGSSQNALTEPHSIVLTRSQALVLFGHQEVVGQVVTLLGRVPLKVTGVIEDVRYTHLHFNAILPFPLIAEFVTDTNVLNEFGAWNYFTFLKLNEQAEAQEVEATSRKILNDYVKENSSDPREMDYFFRPFSDIYFADQIAHEAPVRHGSRRTVKAFSLIALFVLLIAMINFMNMSTARAFTRAREVGVRKLLGSSRNMLMSQFLVESVITTAVAVLLAVQLVLWILPDFNSLAGTSFQLADMGWLNVSLLILTGTLIIGFLSGIYPAFYLTAFQPVMVLKGHKTLGKRGLLFRKTLIVFQFAVSIALIAATLIVFGQIGYMKNQQLGFDKNGVIYFEINFHDRKEAFRQELLAHPQVLEVSFSNTIPGSVNWQESTRVNGVSKQFTFWPVHAGYLTLLDVHPVAGRHFDSSLRSEMGKVIMINETAIHFFELEGSYDQILGQEIIGRRIVGILPDFHYNSLQQKIAPLVVCWDENRSYIASVKTTGHNMPQVAAFLGEVREQYAPNRFFRHFYLDEAYDKYYQGEEQFGGIMVGFSAFAIFIACLGLFGLASYMTAQRTREVSIRKIIGAGMMRIYFMLLKDFLLLVAIGLVLAVPTVLLVMNRWLSGFAYQQQITSWPFVVAGLLAMGITILTISFHAFRVMRTNPAEALRNE